MQSELRKFFEDFKKPL